MNREERFRYYASREWALLKERVKARSGGICERCGNSPHYATHHLTYVRFGHESLEDLQGVCDPCHEFLSGKSSFDPRISALLIHRFCRVGLKEQSRLQAEEQYRWEAEEQCKAEAEEQQMEEDFYNSRAEELHDSQVASELNLFEVYPGDYGRYGATE